MDQEKISVTKAKSKHIKDMNHLSFLKRKYYEENQPVFWKWAGKQGEIEQQKWFKELVERDNYICLIAESGAKTVGFIIGQIVNAPAVYNPGSKTVIIDDFCVLDDKWDVIGGVLVDAIKEEMRERALTQLVIVSGSHDVDKKKLIENSGLSAVSYWYVGQV